MLADLLKKIDIFGTEPRSLEFGDPANPKQRDMHKNACGGAVTILYATLVIAFLIAESEEMFNGKLKWSSVTSEIHPDKLGMVSFDSAQMVPHIAIVSNTISDFVVPEEQQKHYWAGFIEFDHNTASILRVEEFIPCKNNKKLVDKYGWKENDDAWYGLCPQDTENWGVKGEFDIIRPGITPMIIVMPCSAAQVGLAAYLDPNRPACSTPEEYAAAEAD